MPHCESLHSKISYRVSSPVIDMGNNYDARASKTSWEIPDFLGKDFCILNKHL